MAASLESSTADRVSGNGSPAARPGDGPAGRASRRVWRVGAALGLLGLLSFAVVFLRLAEHWRVAPSASHHITVFGQTLSYPAANAAAVLLIVLAGLGAVVTVIALWEITRELSAARAVARRLAALHPSYRDGVWVLEDDHPAAFCAGLLRPRVYITTGAVAALDGPGLDAVLLHERQPARSAAIRRIPGHRTIPVLRSIAGSPP
jgi:Zn-dependent protease with chaperone function